MSWLSRVLTPRPIFVSYARHDGGVLARHLQEDLNAAGFDVWIDTSEIEGGASWSVAIEEALDKAEVALVILSHAAHVSEICRAEQIMSLDKGKRVIPLLAQSDAPAPCPFVYTPIPRFFQRCPVSGTACPTDGLAASR